MMYVENWKAIRQQKQAKIDKNYKEDNRNQRDHGYRVGDKVLLRYYSIKIIIII